MIAQLMGNRFLTLLIKNKTKLFLKIMRYFIIQLEIFQKNYILQQKYLFKKIAKRGRDKYQNTS